MSGQASCGVVRHPAGQRDQGVGAELVEVLVVERRRAPAAAEGEAERRVRDRAVRMTLGGNAESAGGQTWSAVELDRVLGRRARRRGPRRRTSA